MEVVCAVVNSVSVVKAWHFRWIILYHTVCQKFIGPSVLKIIVALVLLTICDWCGLIQPNSAKFKLLKWHSCTLLNGIHSFRRSSVVTTYWFIHLVLAAIKRILSSFLLQLLFAFTKEHGASIIWPRQLSSWFLRWNRLGSLGLHLLHTYLALELVFGLHWVSRLGLFYAKVELLTTSSHTKRLKRSLWGKTTNRLNELGNAVIG